MHFCAIHQLRQFAMSYKLIALTITQKNHKLGLGVIDYETNGNLDILLPVDCNSVISN